MGQVSAPISGHEASISLSPSKQVILQGAVQKEERKRSSVQPGRLFSSGRARLTAMLALGQYPVDHRDPMLSLTFGVVAAIALTLVLATLIPAETIDVMLDWAEKLTLDWTRQMGMLGGDFSG